VNKILSAVGFVISSYPCRSKRNRFVSWESVSQRPNKSGELISTSRIAFSFSRHGITLRITHSLVSALFRVSYTFFKVVYEVAKIITRGLSSIRQFKFVADYERHRI